MKQTLKIGKELNDIDSVILDGVEIQCNGIIRNSKGRLIGRLVDDVEYNSEHVKGLATQPQPIKEESKDIEKRDSVFYEARLKDTLLNVGFTEELLLAILKELEKINSLTKRNIK